MTVMRKGLFEPRKGLVELTQAMDKCTRDTALASTQCKLETMHFYVYAACA
jgi:hypothetical protein